MIKHTSLVALVAMLAGWACAAHAEDNIKVGVTQKKHFTV